MVSVSRTTLAMVLIGGLMGSPGMAGAQDSAGDPASTEALVGDWVLNELLSDDPSSLIPRRAVPPGARQREAETPPSGTDPLRQAAQRFSLSQPDSTIIIDYPDRELVLKPDGQEQVDVVRDDLEIEYRAWRDGATLVIERRLQDDVLLTERYSLHDPTGRLHVLTRLESERLAAPISFIRVYDRTD